MSHLSPASPFSVHARSLLDYDTIPGLNVSPFHTETSKVKGLNVIAAFAGPIAVKVTDRQAVQ